MSGFLRYQRECDFWDSRSFLKAVQCQPDNMDYVTRQFIVLSKKLRDEFRKARESLHLDLLRVAENLKNLEDVLVKKHDDAERQTDKAPIRVVTETKRSKLENVWAYVKGTLETLGIIAVVVYTIVAYRQWKELISSRHQTQHIVDASVRNAAAAEQANENARKQFQQDERPYIWITDDPGEVSFYPDAKKPTVGRIAWSFSFTNYGKSPAHHLWMEKFTRIGVNAPLQAAHNFERAFEGGTPLPPNQKELLSVASEREITPSEFQNLLRIERGISVRVIFHYKDFYGTDYLTEVCYTKYVSGLAGICEGSLIK